jgi:peptidylprolyl isomerase
MARAGEVDSANSQFYIVLAPSLKLDRNYTVWGRVTSGMEYVDAIEKGEPPANPSKIIQASIAADKVPPPPASTFVVPAAAPPLPMTTVPVRSGTPPVLPSATAPPVSTPPQK